MITHLISTTEFVKLLLNTSPYDLPDEIELNPLRVIHNYANFISQKPLLQYFVPCDEEGNVLEEPEEYNSWLNKKSIDWGKVPFNVDLHTFEKYKEAQSKVLFKGWVVHHGYQSELRLHNNNCKLTLDWDFFKFKDSLEEALFEGVILELTETALKRIL